MLRLKEYILNEELDDNLFWKIDNYYKDRDEELKSFNGLVDVCRTNRAYNSDTISAYLAGNDTFNKNVKNLVDFLDDTIKPDPSVNKDYTKALHNIVKTVISNKTDGTKYTNIKEGLINRKVNIKTPIKYSPETRNELNHIILDLFKKGITDLNCIDVSNITDMGYIFHDVRSKVNFGEIDISGWDVSNVEYMEGMFQYCGEFNADLSKWNVSNVTNMDGMFDGCTEFNSDLSKWDVSNVEDMEEMFYNCYKFNSDLSRWKLQDGCQTFRMFKHCKTLEKNNNIPTWYKEQV